MRILILALLVALAAVSGLATESETVVTPLPGEDFTSACHYTLNLPTPDRPVRAVWLIFDRGRDVHDLYHDRGIQAFAQKFNVAVLLHGHCPGDRPEDHNDMNMEPEKGLGPALLRALGQFSTQTGHAELRTAKFILLGFSGAGSLCARLVAFFPERVICAILSAPGHYEPVGIDTVELDQRAVSVPELIIAGGADNVCGTAKPYQYFCRYRSQRAPWVFVVQNKSPHCCTANAKPLILAWLEQILRQRCSQCATEPLRAIDQRKGWLTSFKTRDTNILDDFHLKTFDAIQATIEPVEGHTASQQTDAGWLPTEAVARLWLSFVQEEKHPVLPLN